MAQSEQKTVTMNAMQAQLKVLTVALTIQKISKRKYYCWSCGSNYTHGSKTLSSKKSGHQDEDYYKKRLGGSKKGREWQLGATMNKTKIINPKISLINCINTPPNPPSNNMLAITE